MMNTLTDMSQSDRISSASVDRQTERPQTLRYSIGRRMIETDHYNLVKTGMSLYAPLFADCKRVLDLGCAQGTFLALLEQAGIDAVGVELDPDLAADARARGHKVICDDAIRYLKTTADRYDGVFCSHVIEHLAVPTVIDLIENTQRLLAPGGLFVLVTPNPESLNSRVGFWRTLDHVRPYYRDSLMAILRHYGFERCRNVPDGAVWRGCTPALTRSGVPDNRSWTVTRTLRTVRRGILSCIGLRGAASALDAAHDTVIVVRRPT